MTSEAEAPNRRAEVEAELRSRTMYDLLGGESALRTLVGCFYDAMDTDEAFRPIRAMHQADLAPMRVSLFEYLSGWLGGPPLYIERKGSPCMTSAHAPYAIGRQERDLWVECMDRALVDADVDEKYRELLMPAFGRMADMIRNTD